jgi:glycolate oxidase FAD binding subunit
VTGSFQPRDETELSDTVRGCASEHRRIRISGGGLVSRNPSEGTLGIWMSGITGVVDVRANDLVATARAGTSLEELDGELRERGRRFPLRPHDAGGRASVGGAFAAAADGLVGRMGFRTRDALLGARAVLPSGQRVEVGAKVVKSVAGYDVCKALVGSRGCLAAVTELTFRIEPIPEASLTLVAHCAIRPAAHAAVAVADALPFAPVAIVVSPRDGAIRVDVLLEGPRAAVEASAALLGRAGFERGAGEWAKLTAFAAVDAPRTHYRAVGRASRAAPLDSLPPGADGYVIDVLRGRWYARVVGTAPAAPPPDPLLARLRAAFDPDDLLEPGRGIAAP